LNRFLFAYQQLYHWASKVTSIKRIVAPF
jgi:hypothetical protein